MTRSFMPSAAIMAAIPAPSALHAEAGRPTGQWFDQTRENAWLIPYDTTLASRRTLSEVSHKSHADGDFWKIENSLRGADPIGVDLDFGVQMMVPVKRIDTDADSGLGDLEFRSGLVGRASPSLRRGAGVNVEFDTATDSALGSNALILRPTLALRWDVGERLNLGINAEYSFTPEEERNDDVSALELRFPLVIMLTDVWSAAATYKPRWNLLAESDRHRLELTCTRIWEENKQYASLFGTEFPLSSESLDLKLISSLIWYF
jgi:hypothetical protein